METDNRLMHFDIDLLIISFTPMGFLTSESAFMSILFGGVFVN